MSIRTSVFDKILYSRRNSALEFNFDSLWMPSMANYISLDDLNQLYYIATSPRLMAKVDVKYKMIDEIMTRNNFRKFHAGTNRVVYKNLDDQKFLAKIGIDRVGISDNFAEYKNQSLLKPFVTKIFEVSPNGVMSFVERIDPITSQEEFFDVGEDVFNLLVFKILGKYVLEDIGTDFFMNWGIRIGFGPCLLDFPYIYELDGRKMHCTRSITKGRKLPICNGEIDYDEGFNTLVCTKCGARYLAKELGTAEQNKLIIFKEDNTMEQIKVKLVNANTGETVCDPFRSTNNIMPFKRPVKEQNITGGIRVRLVDNSGKTVAGYDKTRQPELTNTEDEVKEDVVVKQQQVTTTFPEPPKCNPEEKEEPKEETTATVNESTEEMNSVEEVKVENTETTEKEQFVYYNVLKEAMDTFKFELYEKADLVQKFGMINFLTLKLTQFVTDNKSDLSSADIVRIVGNYIDLNYKFELPSNAEEEVEDQMAYLKTVPKEEAPKHLSHMEERYQDVPTYEKMYKKGNLDNF